MVFLPEGTDYLADTIEESMKLVEPMDGPTVKYYQELASSLGVWLSIGIHSKVSPGLHMQI